MIGSQASDDMLVKRCLEGDSSAFRQLIERHQGRLYAYAYNLMGNSDEAQDVVQETFISAYQALPKYVPQGYFHAWLHRIATNQCLRRLRGRKKLVAWEEVDPLLPDNDPGPEEALIDDERRNIVRQAINRLPEDYRIALSLRYDADMSYAEIAQTLGVPVSTIETRLFRAKEKLKKLLDGKL